MGIGTTKFKIGLRKAVFLDRDGVINEVVDRGKDFIVSGQNIRYTAPFSYSEFILKPEAEDCLTMFGQLGFLRILVTNQPDIVYGLLLKEEHQRIMTEVRRLPLDDVFVCLHGRQENCQCKKPKPGMIQEAIQKWNLDSQLSYMIGDTENDVLAGKSAGCKTILIDCDYNKNVIADIRVRSLREAVDIIKV